MRETLQSILHEATDSVVQTLSRDRAYNEWDYSEIEQKIMTHVRVRITSHNYRCAKGDPKISCPRKLDFWQIAEVLNACLDLCVMTVPGHGKKPVLCIRRPRSGRYTTDLKPLHLAATYLDRTITTAGLASVERRLKLICRNRDGNTAEEEDQP